MWGGERSCAERGTGVATGTGGGRGTSASASVASTACEERDAGRDESRVCWVVSGPTLLERDVEARAPPVRDGGRLGGGAALASVEVSEDATVLRRPGRGVGKAGFEAAEVEASEVKLCAAVASPLAVGEAERAVCLVGRGAPAAELALAGVGTSVGFDAVRRESRLGSSPRAVDVDDDVDKAEDGRGCGTRPVC